jgi:hypothetical protein
MFPFPRFCDLEDITFEIFNISENNISNVKLAKVLGPFFSGVVSRIQSHNNITKLDNHLISWVP